MPSNPMKQHDDYTSGPHSYRVHFWCGLVFGAIVGAWFSRNFFDSPILVCLGALTTGLACGLFCGRWGDSAWQRLLERLRWWF